MSVFAAIAGPRRRQLLESLQAGAASVGTLVDRTQMSQPLVSKHLRVLRDAGLVDVEVHGQQRHYRLTLQPLHELDSWLQGFRDVWAGTSTTALPAAPG